MKAATTFILSLIFPLFLAGAPAQAAQAETPVMESTSMTDCAAKRKEIEDMITKAKGQLAAQKLAFEQAVAAAQNITDAREALERAIDSIEDINSVIDGLPAGHPVIPHLEAQVQALEASALSIMDEIETAIQELKDAKAAAKKAAEALTKNINDFMAKLAQYAQACDWSLDEIQAWAEQMLKLLKESNLMTQTILAL